ncbi:MAG: hypothetical protein JWP32_2896 [Schumannella sp.]|nr:hypothetical protein [Schumannella sp.]
MLFDANRMPPPNRTPASDGATGPGPHAAACTGGLTLALGADAGFTAILAGVHEFPRTGPGLHHVSPARNPPFGPTDAPGPHDWTTLLAGGQFAANAGAAPSVLNRMAAAAVIRSSRVRMLAV